MKSVLIVDDVKGWRDYHTDAINKLYNNANITTADSAAAAYDILLSRHYFDIIITDLQMEDDYLPKLAGEWLVEQVKSFVLYNKSKIVIISASYNAKYIAESLGVQCIPKATALKNLAAYKDALRSS